MFIINQFYLILIPLVVGGFAMFIGTDVYRRTRERMRRNKPHKNSE